MLQRRQLCALRLQIFRRCQACLRMLSRRSIDILHHKLNAAHAQRQSLLQKLQHNLVLRAHDADAPLRLRTCLHLIGHFLQRTIKLEQTKRKAFAGRVMQRSAERLILRT